jgi:hypothetical protein
MELFKETNYLPKGYLISNTGKVKSPFNCKILKQSISNSGYFCINIKNKGYFVHRAMAFAFIPSVDGKDFVNHKNGIKIDLNLTNLEWCTRSENINHCYELGLKTYKPMHNKGKFGKEHNRSKSVKCLESGIVYGSMSEAERLLNMSHSSVSWAIKHKKTIFGMHFEIAH